MRRWLGLWLCCGLALPAGAAPPPAETPEGLVRAFMADYRDWNDRAYRSTGAQGTTERSMAAVQADYDRLLSRYCRPDFKGEPIAFGSEADHDPAVETVLSVHTDGERSVVKTRHRRRVAGLLMEDDYEYRLSREHGRWYLDQVYYVDSEGKCPGL